MGWKASRALGALAPLLHPISISHSHLWLCAGLCCAYFQEHLSKTFVPEKCPSSGPLLKSHSFLSYNVLLPNPLFVTTSSPCWFRGHVWDGHISHLIFQYFLLQPRSSLHFHLPLHLSDLSLYNHEVEPTLSTFILACLLCSQIYNCRT